MGDSVLVKSPLLPCLVVRPHVNSSLLWPLALRVPAQSDSWGPGDPHLLDPANQLSLTCPLSATVPSPRPHPPSSLMRFPKLQLGL